MDISDAVFGLIAVALVRPALVFHAGIVAGMITKRDVSGSVRKVTPLDAALFAMMLISLVVCVFSTGIARNLSAGVVIATFLLQFFTLIRRAILLS